jgi:hypothetical protein
MMLSLTGGEPDGYQQIEIKIRKDVSQIVSPGKAIGQEQCVCPIEARRFDD